jgi:hypothetical protein
MSRNRDNRWVNMSQQRTEPRFTSRPEYSDTPDPWVPDEDGHYGGDGQDDGWGETLV